MERLTNKDWRNFDPWECCGQDKYCQRGCHDPGGCTKGCIVPRLYARLGAYEDTELTPEEINDLASAREISPEAEYAINKHADNIIERLDKLLHQTDDDARLRELAEADKAGRLVVLPCKVGDVVYGFHGEKTILPMVVKWIETCTNGWCIAVQYAPTAARFYQFSDFGKTVFLTSEEAKTALEAMKDE